jgi:hypothetical protein
LNNPCNTNEKCDVGNEDGSYICSCDYGFEASANGACERIETDDAADEGWEPFESDDDDVIEDDDVEETD